MKAFIKADGATLCTVDYDGKTEESLWKPAGEFIAKNQPKEPGELVIETETGESAVLRFINEDGKTSLSTRRSRNGIGLEHSLYKVKKMRKIDAATGVHRLYDICPNSMGSSTYDVGAQFGDTGGTNVGADAVTGVYTLKEPFPAYFYWYKYYQLTEMGYKDYTDMIYDEEEEFSKLEKLFGNEMEVPDIPTNTTMKVFDFLKGTAKAMLEQTMDIEGWILGEPPFGRRQINSAWKTWEKFKTVDTVQKANDVSLSLVAVTNVSFKEKGKGKIDISYFLIRDIKEIQRLIDYWEAMIKSMEAMLPAASKKGANEKTLSAFGDVEMELAEEKESRKILKEFHAPGDLRYTVVKVHSHWSDERFEKYCGENNITDRRLFCHGSSTANWVSIVRQGLLINPNAPTHGKAFGWGIYTARDFVKSFGYTSFDGSKWAYGTDDVGVLGVYETAYGKPMYPRQVRNDTYEHAVKSGGYNCLDAVAKQSGFRMDEIIFYKEEALTLKYLVFASRDEKYLEFLAD